MLVYLQNTYIYEYGCFKSELYVIFTNDWCLKRYFVQENLKVVSNKLRVGVATYFIQENQLVTQKVEKIIYNFLTLFFPLKEIRAYYTRNLQDFSSVMFIEMLLLFLVEYNT